MKQAVTEPAARGSRSVWGWIPDGQVTGAVAGISDIRFTIRLCHQPALRKAPTLLYEVEVGCRKRSQPVSVLGCRKESRDPLS